jgi:hypothetical protein
VRTAANQRGDARSTSICQYIQHVLSRKDSKLLVIANISAESLSFSQTKDALEFVADISKLKRFQKNSPAYVSAVKAAADHDQKIKDKGKPWKMKKPQQRKADNELDFIFELGNSKEKSFVAN